MQVAGGRTFRVNIIIYPLNLFGCQFERIGNGFDRDTVVLPVQAKIHFIVWKRKIKLILPLFERIGIGRGRATPNFIRHIQVPVEGYLCASVWVCGEYKNYPAAYLLSLLIFAIYFDVLRFFNRISREVSDKLVIH